ncbi:MAG: VCBS repeat-containing protein [Planctomycetes bacterium]|nr:VCBS repeat-containing protein [Planctomycetota bacterium]
MSDTRKTLRIVVFALTIACLADLSSANAQDVQRRDHCFSQTASALVPVGDTCDLRDGGGGPFTGDILALTHPLHSDIFRAGDVVEINGTVDGPNFESYSAEWGFGENPTEWFTAGMELANGGGKPVVDGTLALWDTSSITDAAFATLRVTAAFTGSQLEELRTLYLDPTFEQGWPVKVYSTSEDVGLFEVRVADLNRDRYREVIAYMAGDPPTLHVYDHTGTALPNYPIQVEPTSGRDGSVPFPVVGDMNNDGYDEIVVFRPKNWNGNCTDPPCVLVYNYDGDLLSTFPVSYPGFSYPNWCRDFASGKQKLALADLDRDGNLEIVIVGEWAVTVLDNQGNTFDDWPKHIYGWIGGTHEGTASFGNLDADEDLEIVIAEDWADPPNEPGVDRGRVYAYNLDGSAVPGWPVTTRGYSFASPTLGDINNDGQEEIVIGFMYYPDDPGQCGVSVYDRYGDIVTGWPQLQGYEVCSNPVLADFNGDSQLEIVVSVVGGWTYMLRNDGSVVDGWPQQMCWTDWYSPVIGDITGDGLPDVITNNNHLDGQCAVYAWDFQGDLIDGFPKITGASLGGPVAIADIDNDDRVELIATSNVRVSGDVWLDQGCLYVWDLDARYAPSTMHWPTFQHDRRNSGRYAPPPICFGDLDGDGYVDLSDLAELLSDYGTTSGARYEDGDLDGDGDVDLADLAALLAVYGTTCD